MEVEYVLGNDNQPVLFCVPQRIYSPEQASLFLSQGGVLGGEIDALFETDACLLIRIEHSYLPLNEDRLQQHLGGMLHVEQHTGDASVVVASIK